MAAPSATAPGGGALQYFSTNSPEFQAVFSNSPAEGNLQRGDVIVTINDKAGENFTHKQAQDVIKTSGGQIALVINRPPSGKPQVPQDRKQQQVQIPTQAALTRSPSPKTPNPSMHRPHLSSPHRQRSKRGKAAKTPKSPRQYGGGGFEFAVDYRKSTKLPKKPKKYGGGGFDFGTCYIDARPTKGAPPLLGPKQSPANIVAETDTCQQTYRTHPLESTNPTMPPPVVTGHKPKGGYQYGGSGVDYSVNYQAPGLARQHSRPWEDEQMLKGVQESLIKLPFQGSPSHPTPQYQPAFPTYHQQQQQVPFYQPPQPAPMSAPTSFVPPPWEKPEEEEEEDYEFVPVWERRKQFTEKEPKPQKAYRSVKPPAPKSKPPRQDGRAPTMASWTPVTAPKPQAPARPQPMPVQPPPPSREPEEEEEEVDASSPWSDSLRSVTPLKLWELEARQAAKKPTSYKRYFHFLDDEELHPGEPYAGEVEIKAYSPPRVHTTDVPQTAAGRMALDQQRQTPGTLEPVRRPPTPPPKPIKKEIRYPSPTPVPFSPYQGMTPGYQAEEKIRYPSHSPVPFSPSQGVTPGYQAEEKIRYPSHSPVPFSPSQGVTPGYQAEEKIRYPSHSPVPFSPSQGVTPGYQAEEKICYPSHSPVPFSPSQGVTPGYQAEEKIRYPSHSPVPFSPSQGMTPGYQAEEKIRYPSHSPVPFSPSQRMTPGYQAEEKIRYPSHSPVPFSPSQRMTPGYQAEGKKRYPSHSPVPFSPSQGMTPGYQAEEKIRYPSHSPVPFSPSQGMTPGYQAEEKIRYPSHSPVPFSPSQGMTPGYQAEEKIRYSSPTPKSVGLSQEPKPSAETGKAVCYSPLFRDPVIASKDITLSHPEVISSLPPPANLFTSAEEVTLARPTKTLCDCPPPQEVRVPRGSTLTFPAERIIKNRAPTQDPVPAARETTLVHRSEKTPTVPALEEAADEKVSGPCQAAGYGPTQEDNGSDPSKESVIDSQGTTPSKAEGNVATKSAPESPSFSYVERRNQQGSANVFKDLSESPPCERRNQQVSANVFKDLSESPPCERRNRRQKSGATSYIAFLFVICLIVLVYLPYDFEKWIGGDQEL